MAPQDTPTPPPTPQDPYTTARLSLKEKGYAILPATLLPHLPLPALRTAATTLTTSARTGTWPYIRTVPKQFPPWPSDPTHGIWGIQHVLHPSNPSHTVFASTYFDPSMLRYARELIGCADADLTLELCNLLVDPPRDFQLRWHRDDIPPSATDAEERAQLALPAGHAQWNLALFADESLLVVPGSHSRARTPEERDAGPYDTLTGQEVVRLLPGEVVFYDNNILHRGVYDAGRVRATLHGSVGCVGAGRRRARNVLQHGVGEWAGGDFLGGLQGETRERAERMRGALVELGRGWEGGFFAEGE